VRCCTIPRNSSCGGILKAVVGSISFYIAACIYRISYVGAATRTQGATTLILRASKIGKKVRCRAIPRSVGCGGSSKAVVGSISFYIAARIYRISHIGAATHTRRATTFILSTSKTGRCSTIMCLRRSLPAMHLTHVVWLSTRNS
jgi:hypothetical protein